MNKLIFYAHIAKELSTSSFVRNIGCNLDIATSELLIYIRPLKYSRRLFEAFVRK